MYPTKSLGETHLVRLDITAKYYIYIDRQSSLEGSTQPQCYLKAPRLRPQTLCNFYWIFFNSNLIIFQEIISSYC